MRTIRYLVACDFGVFADGSHHPFGVIYMDGENLGFMYDRLHKDKERLDRERYETFYRHGHAKSMDPLHYFHYSTGYHFDNVGLFELDLDLNQLIDREVLIEAAWNGHARVVKTSTHSKE